MPRYLVAALVLSSASLVACGGSTLNVEQSFTDLRQAIDSPVPDAETSAKNSLLVEAMLEEHVFDDLFRREIEEKLGRGEDCSRHPRCAEQGFEADDWYYTIGQLGDSATGSHMPVLILGFDRTGRVVRAWNLTTH